ncbi:capsular polysaccharide biosynthesis protein [Helicobacter sp. 14348-15]|uniref:capsular polysaccharide biosynthesis protein n=1 Tax=Helicobacter colisuis TaxID=2949739 RepID=UPI00202B371B|nr:capsular polysaccharide biosynthesis protein [Helicobacter colisuis]MCL9821049.1 capsular polysaccharide biosynthesis protein [Helicobacter colisuis]
MTFYLYNIRQLFSTKCFKGWGRKKTGKFARFLAKIFKKDFLLLEDGFIRSFGLGIEDSPSFSIVQDNLGIYYDSTTKSQLENILNTYDFNTNPTLLKTAKEAIHLITTHHISKYNHTPDVPQNYFAPTDSTPTRILIISQTQNDSSLIYGNANACTTSQIIQDALAENPNCEIYLKIHPDVLSGRKKSDFNPSEIPAQIKLIYEDFNPISLLKHFKKVYTKTSQMGFEALLVGCECVCYGMPFYAGWGLTIDKQTCPRRKRKLKLEEVFAASYILYSHYYNPFYQRKSDILDTLQTLICYKHYYIKTHKKAFMFGFSTWKHTFIPPFMPNFNPKNIIFINPFFSSHLKVAFKKGLLQEALKQNCKIFIWGRKSFSEIETFAKEHSIPLTRVEDGFIRSISLGSDLTRPFSQVFDECGIYFDATTQSDLETILNHTTFNQTLLEEAKILKDKILTSKISKYNTNPHKFLNLPPNQLKILIPGQVEDDASIIYGAKGRTNLSLLKEVREKNPKAYILYKPHPDVLSGNRIGNIPSSIALQYCDEILIDISLPSCLEAVDEVHTLTSLSGFEALLYGKRVITYGMPFYAGWGLTIDKQTCPRRTRKLTLDELIAGAYILYPRYIHPKTLQLCHPLALIDALEEEKRKLQNNRFYALKKRLYSLLSRKAQRFLRLLAIK